MRRRWVSVKEACSTLEGTSSPKVAQARISWSPVVDEEARCRRGSESRERVGASAGRWKDVLNLME